LKPAVKRFKTGAAMAACASGIFEKALLKKKGSFLAALSGGKTPARLFQKLAKMPLPWERAVFFMADERLVPPSSPESNFGSAHKLFFSKIKVPRPSLHPVRAVPGAAAAYGREILKATKGSGRLDFVLLGLGEDGHTASLFPGAPALKEKKRLVCPSLAPQGSEVRRRITLTLKAINRASTVVLMAAGTAKKKVFERALRRDKKIPAGLLDPRGEMYFLFSEKP
jgi:6-phosphogluconolactonase